MRFRIKVKGKNDEWWEEYNKPIEDPEKWGRDLIDWFNSTCQPGETHREFLAAEKLEDAGPEEHDWEKQNLMTISDRVGVYDAMKCRRCGVTGKRFGLGNGVRLDSKWKAKGYLRCDTAAALMKKREWREHGR